MEEPTASSIAQRPAPQRAARATGEHSAANWSSVGMSALIVVLVGCALLMAIDFNDSARQLPMIIGVPTFLISLVMLVVEVAKVLRRRRRQDHRVGAISRGSVQVLVVFVGLAASYLALGFPWGSALFLFGYLWSGARVGLLKSFLITGGVVVPTYFIFVELLETPIFPGVVGS